VAALWLSDAELTELLHDLARIIQPRLAYPESGRNRGRLRMPVTLTIVNQCSELR